MHYFRRIFAVATVASALSVTGCTTVAGVLNGATTEDAIVAKTAAYFSTDRANIRVADIGGLLHETTYKATYKGTPYNCSIVYGSVVCLKPGEDFHK